MPFPFLPAGLVLAAAILGSAYALFTLFLRAFDRAAFTARNSIAPGIVAGLRTWSHDPVPERRASSRAAAEAQATRPANFARAAADEPNAEIVELDDAGAVPMETVRRR